MELSYPLLNLISLPAAKVGKMAIVQRPYPADEEFTVVSIRTSYMTGQKQAKTVAVEPGVIHKLVEDGHGEGCWMSDLPCEIWQHAGFVDKLYGKVLVGGLGLGLILKMLEQNPRIKSVTVVEKSKDVIDLVWSNLKLKYRADVVNADLFKFLQDCKDNRKRFDSAYYDIWTCDSASVYGEYIQPLRELSKGVVTQKNLYCWQEDVILSQLN